jgi:hypothetical protein
MTLEINVPSVANFRHTGLMFFLPLRFAWSSVNVLSVGYDQLSISLAGAVICSA